MFAWLGELVFCYYRSLKKWLLRKLTKLCELQRLCYDQPVGSARSLKVEYSLELSKSEDIKRMILMLNDAAECKNFTGSHQKALLERAVGTIMSVKRINPRCHVPFVKSITRCIEHIWGYKELYRVVEDLRLTQYDPSVTDHEAKLTRLWNALCPDVPLEARITKQWQDIGFQGDDPKTDFRGMGMLGLENLLYFAEEYNQAARHVLSHSLHPQNGYAFAIVGINMTSMTYHLLKDGTAKTHVFNVCKSSPSLRVFHQLYSFLFYEFDCFWIKSKPEDVMQFKFIRDKFEDKIREALSDPMTAFKTAALADIVNNDNNACDS